MSLRDRLDKRMAQLKTERAKGWEATWRDLQDNIAPNVGEINTGRVNEGDRRDRNIYNNTATRAVTILQGGMSSGLTSASRSWFKLATPDPDLMEFGPVKVWLHHAEQAMRELFVKSNLYNVLPSLYGELGVFGTGVMAAMPDDKGLIRFYPFTVGSYYLATSNRQMVDTIYREFKMTARQMAQQFGKDALCASTQAMLTNNSEAWIDVCHAVEPNGRMDSSKDDNKNMPFRSVYWEKASNQGQVLRESGFKTFPVMAPRWDVTGQSVYGYGPGSMALGDAKALQLMEKRKLEMVEKGVRPPMTAPSSLRNQRMSILPGDVTYVDVSQGMQGFVPTIEVNPAWVGVIRGEIDATEQRIHSAFFSDLFLMISQMDEVRTATEIAARKEEKMLMLGPVLERLNDELLDPLIDRAFSMMLEQSMPRWAGMLPGKPLLPPPPEELAGMDLRVEYTSILAQAQKALGVTSIERTVAFAGNLAGIAPEIMDKLNLEQAIDEYAAMTGTPPTMIRSDDEVAAIREQRAAAAQQQQMMEQAGQAIQGAKLLSETNVSDENALTTMLNGQ